VLQPDEFAEPWHLEEWMQALDRTTAFINFAQTYLERGGRSAEDFEVDDSLVTDFRRFLEEAGVRVPPQGWERSLSFLKTRLHAEIFGLRFGASKSSEIEIRHDPQVRAAVNAMPRAKQLLIPGRSSPVAKVGTGR
jgi:carboxyl-terminal processing protease